MMFAREKLVPVPCAARVYEVGHLTRLVTADHRNRQGLQTKLDRGKKFDHSILTLLQQLVRPRLDNKTTKTIASLFDDQSQALLQAMK